MFSINANRLTSVVRHYRHYGQRLAVLLVSCWSLASVVLAEPAQGLLYHVYKPGEASAHYLFGTMHASDPRVIRILEKIRQPLRQSRQLVMEMVPDVSAILSGSTRMLLPAEHSLQQLAGDKLYAEVLHAAIEKGLNDETLQRLKPWAATVAISMPESDGAFLDQRIYQLALENNQPVYGLETATEQLAVFDSLSLPLQTKMLEETLQQLDHLPVMFDAMVEAYSARDLAQLQKLMREYELSSSDDALVDWFNQELIVKRNYRMARRLQVLLEKGNSFVAVGALHLVDESGLIQALRQAGYRVESIY